MTTILRPLSRPVEGVEGSPFGTGVSHLVHALAGRERGQSILLADPTIAADANHTGE